MSNVKVLALALTVVGGAALSTGCDNHKRRDDPPPQQQQAQPAGKTAPTKSDAGVPVGGGTEPAPQGQSAPLKGSSGQ